MIKKLKTVAVVGSLLLFTGCASIMHGTKQSVSFSTQPAGATILINDQVKGVTPISIELTRSEAKVVKFVKEGYVSAEMPIQDSIDPIWWGNILIGGVLGSTTDAGTGAMFQYDPNSYFVEMKKDETKKEEM